MHLCGFFFVCVRMCRLRLPALANALPQPAHVQLCDPSAMVLPNKKTNKPATRSAAARTRAACSARRAGLSSPCSCRPSCARAADHRRALRECRALRVRVRQAARVRVQNSRQPENVLRTGPAAIFVRELALLVERGGAARGTREGRAGVHAFGVGRL